MLVYLLIGMTIIMPSAAPERLIVRDAAGRVTESIRITNNQLVIRDNRGRVTGTVNIKGTSAQYKNGRGQIVTPKGKR